MEPKELNAKVAEIMGWHVEDGWLVDAFRNDIAPENQAEYPIEVAKLLIDKMIDDGWTVTFRQNKRHILFMAYYRLGDPLIFTTSQTKSNAIVELFCRVYGIKGE